MNVGEFRNIKQQIQVGEFVLSLNEGRNLMYLNKLSGILVFQSGIFIKIPEQALFKKSLQWIKNQACWQQRVEFAPIGTYLLLLFVCLWFTQN